MTLNNLVNRIWLRFIKTLNKLTFHFLWKDGLCWLRHSEDGLNLCPPIQGKQTSATNLFKHHNLTLSHS